MNRLLSLLFLTFFIFSSAAIAADRVVVIPLGGAKNYMYWQSDWSVDTSYKIGDGVQYEGSSYVCVEAHQSTYPDSPPSVYWNLLALKGDQGVKGDPGTNGIDGADGVPGIDGADGAPGIDGADGVPGIDGADGAPGADGADGATGPQGPAGPVGQAKGLSVGNEITRTIGTETYIWLDRNLGASQVATAYNDANAYGDLYQWGRGVDGHESRTSPTTTVVSSSDAPKHDNFIKESADWRSTQNDNLWQGVNGINNPCPAGFRLPIDTEWEAERLAWLSEDGNTIDRAGAFASPLKLVSAGLRNYSSGTVDNAGNFGYYWSSTFSMFNSSHAYRLAFSSGEANWDRHERAYGCTVRCLKD